RLEGHVTNAKPRFIDRDRARDVARQPRHCIAAAEGEGREIWDPEVDGRALSPLQRVDVQRYACVQQVPELLENRLAKALDVVVTRYRLERAPPIDRLRQPLEDQRWSSLDSAPVHHALVSRLPARSSRDRPAVPRRPCRPPSSAECSCK